MASSEEDVLLWNSCQDVPDEQHTWGEKMPWQEEYAFILREKEKKTDVLLACVKMKCHHLKISSGSHIATFKQERSVKRGFSAGVA